MLGSSSAVPYMRLRQPYSDRTNNHQHNQISVDVVNNIGTFKDAEYFNLPVAKFEELIQNLCLNLRSDLGRKKAFEFIGLLLEEGESLRNVNLKPSEKEIYDNNQKCIRRNGSALANAVRNKTDDCLSKFCDEIKKHTDELNQVVWKNFRRWVFGESEIN